MSRQKAFKQWVKKDLTEHIQHVEDCPNERLLPNTPIDECPCDCYDKHVFYAGYNAEKGIA